MVDGFRYAPLIMVRDEPTICAVVQENVYLPVFRLITVDAGL